MNIRIIFDLLYWIQTRSLFSHAAFIVPRPIEITTNGCEVRTGVRCVTDRRTDIARMGWCPTETCRSTSQTCRRWYFRNMSFVQPRRDHCVVRGRYPARSGRFVWNLKDPYQIRKHSWSACMCLYMHVQSNFDSDSVSSTHLRTWSSLTRVPNLTSLTTDGVHGSRWWFTCIQVHYLVEMCLLRCLTREQTLHALQSAGVSPICTNIGAFLMHSRVPFVQQVPCLCAVKKQAGFPQKSCSRSPHPIFTIVNYVHGRRIHSFIRIRCICEVSVLSEVYACLSDLSQDNAAADEPTWTIWSRRAVQSAQCGRSSKSRIQTSSKYITSQIHPWCVLLHLFADQSWRWRSLNR